MTYRQIIDKNCESCSPKWWPKYAYHFTDVTNIVSILSSGKLFSRTQATRRGVMENDNASRQVIDMTDARTKSYARFYFRPLTPTQYHNEGFKHAQIRFSGDVHANVPLPVFLVFDLESLLNNENIRFSEQSQAGHGSPILYGEHCFSRMPFDKIYSDGPCDSDTLPYRHAEILCPDYYSIDGSLRMILCRNQCEKATLLNLLYEADRKTYYKYKDFIRIANDKVFQRNGLFVDNVVFHQDTVAFEFACTPEKKRYESRNPEKNLAPIKATYEFRWMNKQGATAYATVYDSLLDYTHPQSITFRLPRIAGAYVLRIALSLDGKAVCVFKQSIDAFEMI